MACFNLNGAVSGMLGSFQALVVTKESIIYFNNFSWKSLLKYPHSTDRVLRNI